MKHLLIVEDDAENNQMIAEYLETQGYKCTQAYSGSEGKLLFEMQSFDLVLLDLMLPGIGGDELVSLFFQKNACHRAVCQKRAGQQGAGALGRC